MCAVGSGFSNEEFAYLLTFLTHSNRLTANLELLHATYDAVSEVAISHLRSGRPYAAAALAANKTILSSPAGLKMARALHHHFRTLPDTALDALPKADILRTTIVFCSLEIARTHPLSLLSPSWTPEDLTDLSNCRRALRKLSERLLSPSIFNSLTPAEVVTLTQHFVVANAVHPALFKAMLLRVSEEERYKVLPPGQLCGFMHRVTSVECLHPVLLKDTIKVLGDWLKRSHVRSRLGDTDCMFALYALASARVKDTALLEALVRRLLEVGMSLKSFSAVIKYVNLIKVGEGLLPGCCEQLLKRKAVDNTLWDAKPVIKGLSHVYKGKKMPAVVRDLFARVVAREGTIKHDLPNSVLLLESMSRTGVEDKETFESLSRQVVRCLDMYKKDKENPAVANLNERVLASYIWAVAPHPFVHHDMVVALRFLVTEDDFVTGLHPTLVPWVLSAFEAWNGPVELRDKVCDTILQHAVTPHVLAEFDANSAWYIWFALNKSQTLTRYVKEVTILMDNIRCNDDMIDSLTHQVAIKVIEALADLHVKNMYEHAMALIKDIFARRIATQSQYIPNDPKIAIRLYIAMNKVKVRDPPILSVLMKMSGDVLVNPVYSTSQRTMLVGVVGLLRIARPGVMDAVAEMLVNSGKPLEVKDLKWILYGLAKSKGDETFVEELCKAALVVKDGEESARFEGDFESQDLSLILWSLSSMKVYPPVFTSILVETLTSWESLSPTPFRFTTGPNMITILTGLSSATPPPPPSVASLLPLLLTRAIDTDVITTLDYTRIKTLVRFLIDLKVDCPVFFRTIREVMIQKEAEGAAA
eukprot:TRINITY_DN16564_c1_g1_i1.p1 TRINITY_DN16564_c1_g1~~TRINITY_DN16564_c1_g1_i1.p1  ORF type:complete len:938 (+),score=234.38 TRINITY_DN16564_c1_g1_i1:371-2815(+)